MYNESATKGELEIHQASVLPSSLQLLRTWGYIACPAGGRAHRVPWPLNCYMTWFLPSEDAAWCSSLTSLQLHHLLWKYGIFYDNSTETTSFSSAESTLYYFFFGHAEETFRKRQAAAAVALCQWPAQHCPMLSRMFPNGPHSSMVSHVLNGTASVAWGHTRVFPLYFGLPLELQVNDVNALVNAVIRRLARWNFHTVRCHGAAAEDLSTSTRASGLCNSCWSKVVRFPGHQGTSVPGSRGQKDSKGHVSQVHVHYVRVPEFCSTQQGRQFWPSFSSWEGLLDIWCMFCRARPLTTCAMNPWDCFC